MNLGIVQTRGARKSAFCLAADPATLAGANINPLTGLSTDYLNHFNEAIMLLEMLSSVPECREDLAAWQPLGYAEHFARSNLVHRDLTIAAYEAAEKTTRLRFDLVSATMRSIVLTTQDAVAASGDEAAGPIAADAAAQLKPLIAQASAVIHGEALREETSVQASQAAIDAIMRP